MWLVVTVVGLVVAVATYVTLVATRVDRLHARAAAAYSALDAQSVRRAAAAASWAERESLAEVEFAAKAVLGAPPPDREQAENDLTLRLRAVVSTAPAGPVGPDGSAGSAGSTGSTGSAGSAGSAGFDLSAPDGAGLIAVRETSRRLGLARQVYTDLVRDARGVRRHPVVRLLRLARRHPEPTFFDIDEPSLDRLDSA